MAWSYRKSITLSRASGAVTNYQMKLLVGESSGAVGEDVDCAAHCKTDFSDLRFTASDGTTLLDYWIESISGATPNQLATIWINFNSIGIGATTFYLYYGFSGASAVSNGSDTFEFFDDFESYSNGNLGGQGNWADYNGNPQVGVIDSKKMALIYDFRKAAITHINFGSAAGAGRSIIAKAKCVTVGEQICFGMGSGAGLPEANEWDVGYNIFYHGMGNTKGAIAEGSGGGAEFITNPAMSASVADTYYQFDSRWYGTTFKGFIDGVEVLTGTDASLSTEDHLWIGCHNSNWAVDWIAVRKYEAVEPTWGSWGNEDSGTWNLGISIISATMHHFSMLRG
jgi:hypothetical protein